MKSTLFILPFLFIQCNSSEKNASAVHEFSDPVKSISPNDSSIINNPKQPVHKNRVEPEKNTLEKFDIQRYKSYDRGPYVRIELNDSIILEIFQHAEGYQENIINKNTLIKSYKIFDKKSFYLTSEGLIFSKIMIGIQKFYNSSGNIEKTIDHDEPFKFSLNDLIVKLKTEYHLEINRDSKVTFRRKAEPTPIYYILFPEEINSPILISLQISGIDGHIISEEKLTTY